MVGWLLLMLVGDPLYLARCTLVTRGRGEHCQVQWLRLIDYHWGTLQYISMSNISLNILPLQCKNKCGWKKAEHLVLGRCRCLREWGDILGAWREVRPNGEGQGLRVQALRLLQGLLLLWRQGLGRSCWR